MDGRIRDQHPPRSEYTPEHTDTRTPTSTNRATTAKNNRHRGTTKQRKKTTRKRHLVAASVRINLFHNVLRRVAHVHTHTPTCRPVLLFFFFFCSAELHDAPTHAGQQSFTFQWRHRDTETQTENATTPKTKWTALDAAPPPPPPMKVQRHTDTDTCIDRQSEKPSVHMNDAAHAALVHAHTVTRNAHTARMRQTEGVEKKMNTRNGKKDEGVRDGEMRETTPPRRVTKRTKAPPTHTHRVQRISAPHVEQLCSDQVRP